MLLEPAREPLVQVGARRLRQRVVRGVADEQVPEPKRVVLGQRRGRRPDELLAHEPQQLRRNRRARPARAPGPRRGGRPAPRPRRARARAARRSAAGRAGRRAAPGSSAARRPRRSAESCTIASICSTKSGLPSAASRIRSRRLAPSSSAPSRRSISSSVSGSVSGSSSTVGRVQLAAAPAGAQLEQLGPRQTEDEQRRVARPVGDVLDQVEERRLGPLQVVEARRPAAGRGPTPRSSRRTARRDVVRGRVTVAEQRRDRRVRRPARRRAAASPPRRRAST